MPAKTVDEVVRAAYHLVLAGTGTFGKAYSARNYSSVVGFQNILH